MANFKIMKKLEFFLAKNSTVQKKKAIWPCHVIVKNLKIIDPIMAESEVQ